MPAEKRYADALGSTQMVVKRQKSNVDLANGRSVALTGGSTGNGALIQAVSLRCVGCYRCGTCAERNCEEGPLMER